MNEFTICDVSTMDGRDGSELKDPELGWLIAVERYVSALSAHIASIVALLEASANLDAADRAVKEHRTKMMVDLIEAYKRLCGEEGGDR